MRIYLFYVPTIIYLLGVTYLYGWFFNPSNFKTESASFGLLISKFLRTIVPVFFKSYKIEAEFWMKCYCKNITSLTSELGVNIVRKWF